MGFLIVLIAILAGTVVLVGVGDRFNLPWPVLLTIATAAVIFVPGMPEVELDAELILPIFLPPLLWALGQRASWQMFRTNWRAIVIYSVVLVVLTILAVTWAALVFIPGITVAAAVAIGAAVAPPDPVAVEAVAEPVGIPRRIVATLQTEGLFNDAVSLVCFQAALTALTADEDLRAGSLALGFLYTAVAAVAVGLMFGWVGSVTMRRLTQSVGRSAMTLIIPFAVYIAAEEVHASGVIAVVVAAVQMSSAKGDLAAEDRLTGTAFWQVLELLLTGVAFGLMGLQLRQVIDDAGSRIGVMVLHGAIVSAVVILLRLAWMLGIVLAGRTGGERLGLTPRTAGEALVMTWAGMRGLVTLALALSVPEHQSGFRAEMLVIAVMVLLLTMVVPGLTLPLLVRQLGLAHEDWQDAQERELLGRAQQAAVGRVRELAAQAPPEVVAAVTDMYSRMAPPRPAEEDHEDYRRHFEQRRQRREMFAVVRDAALAAAQDAVIRARSDRGIDPETVDRVLHQLDQMAAINNPEGSVLLPVMPHSVPGNSGGEAATTLEERAGETPGGR